MATAYTTTTAAEKGMAPSEILSGHDHDQDNDQPRAFHHQHQPSYFRGEPAEAWASAIAAAAPPPQHRKFANPAPLGLSAFALTTFVLSALNMHTRGTSTPNVIISLAFAYGGFVQVLAGMWEMAVGNTFGATAFSSYGGFWIAFAVLLTPSYGALAPYSPAQRANVLGFFLAGWFIFTTMLLLCTLRSTAALFFLFFTLDLAFLLLTCEQFALSNGSEAVGVALQKAGGFFGFLAAFLAWYNALSGMQDSSNSFFQVPVFHFPWSDHAQEMRKQKHHEHQA